MENLKTEMCDTKCKTRDELKVIIWKYLRPKDGRLQAHLNQDSSLCRWMEDSRETDLQTKGWKLEAPNQSLGGEEP